jgi:flagellar biosynthesis/type III secretory pathway protein FliH
VNDSDAPTPKHPETEKAPQRGSQEFLEGYSAGRDEGFDSGYAAGQLDGWADALEKALVAVRARVARCQSGGELRYADLRALEAEIAALLDA